MTPTLHITDDAEADALLSSNPLALLIGMLLDQQVPMETAFAGPAKLLDRIGTLDPKSIADYDPAELEAVFRITPSIHRYPGSMAGRVQALCAAVVETWGGEASAIWTRSGPDGADPDGTGPDGAGPDGAEILRRLKALPGFGEQKAKIFLALLGKQYGLTAAGWRESAGDYGVEGSHRSVADIVNPASLTKVREFKKAAKAAAKRA